MKFVTGFFMDNYRSRLGKSDVILSFKGKRFSWNCGPKATCLPTYVPHILFLGAPRKTCNFLRAEIMSKNERRRTPCLTATDSLAFSRRTLCHKTREQEAVLFRFSGFWSKQGSCSDLNRKAKKQEKLSFPPRLIRKPTLFSFSLSRPSKKNWKKLIFWWVGGGNSFFRSAQVLSREFFDRTFGDKTWVSKQTLRVPCHRVFRHNFRPDRLIQCRPQLSKSTSK